MKMHHKQAFDTNAMELAISLTACRVMRPKDTCVSTVCVFPCDESILFYGEKDILRSKNFYDTTRLLAEQLVAERPRKSGLEALTARTNFQEGSRPAWLKDYLYLFRLRRNKLRAG